MASSLWSSTNQRRWGPTKEGVVVESKGLPGARCAGHSDTLLRTDMCQPPLGRAAVRKQGLQKHFRGENSRVSYKCNNLQIQGSNVTFKIHLVLHTG